MRQFVKLADWVERFDTLGVAVAGMTYDSRAALNKFHTERELPFPLLQDVEVRHVSAYGITNKKYQPGDKAYGIPMPGMVFIDADGVVRAKFAAPGYKKRPSFEAVYDALSALLAQHDTADPDGPGGDAATAPGNAQTKRDGVDPVLRSARADG